MRHECTRDIACLLYQYTLFVVVDRYKVSSLQRWYRARANKSRTIQKVFVDTYVVDLRYHLLMLGTDNSPAIFSVGGFMMPICRQTLKTMCCIFFLQTSVSRVLARPSRFSAEAWSSELMRVYRVERPHIAFQHTFFRLGGTGGVCVRMTI